MSTNKSMFNASLFAEQMTRGGSASIYLCQCLLSWRNFPTSAFDGQLKDFTLAGIDYKLDQSSRHQVISMMQMDMHNSIFQELEAIAFNQLGI
ncbi:hypothetical protein AB4440_07770 [Vibrio splendidus]|uniref:hypothetical protein n=1 Tax=Vibrio TaxID=662 RepID=UPI001F524DB2|nr:MULTISPECIES: hypothetical protein [Vibrio]